MIETSEAAQRLATAILADIHLYNAEAIAAGGDLTEEIEEGRTLYRSRVAPQWHSLFEQAVAQSGFLTEPFDESTANHQVIGTPIQARLPTSRSNLVWFTFGALGLMATMIWQLLR